MRSLALSAAAACVVVVHTTSAFTCPSPSFLVAGSRQNPPKAGHASMFLAHRSDDFEELVPSPKFLKDTTKKPSSSPPSVGQRIRNVSLRTWERMDTLRAAGLHEDGMIPMQSGFKRNVGLFVCAVLFKWYRARFITKIPIWDRQPQWNMVVTRPEQEKDLHAYRCKKCGSTIFIARHREWFFKGGNTECTNCDAKGEENFENIRDEVINSIDDDYFDYESPLDFVSAAERRKLVRQAGGDEELAKKIAINNVMKNDPDQIQVSEEGISSRGNGGSNAGEPGTNGGGNSAPKKDEPVDILEELEMDL